MWYYISLEYATYAINTKNDRVVFTPPIAKWMIGKHIKDIKEWVLSKKNSKMEEYGTKGLKVIQGLSQESILELISEEDIFKKYVGDFRLNKTIRSPLRNKNTDDIPSFSIYYNHYYSRLMYKDFAKTGGDCFKFVSERYGLSMWESLIKINQDFNLGLIASSVTIDIRERKNNEIIYQKTETNIQIIPRKYTQQDFDYWKSFGISKETLRLYNIYCVEKVFIDTFFNFEWSHQDNNPTYAYYFPSSRHIKLYKPLANKIKNCKRTIRFLSSANNITDIQGLEQLPEEGELLIITKSMKDVMLLHELSYPAIAPHGENHYLEENMFESLKKRFKRIVFFYDNDEAGITAAKRNSELYNLKYKILPLHFNKLYSIKDITDYYFRYGEEKTKTILRWLMKPYTLN